jgi:hypothetical protein
LVLATKKGQGSLDIPCIPLIGDKPNTRCTAALNLVQKARSGPIRKNVVGAVTQPKDTLQNLNALLYSPGIGKRAEVVGLLVNSTAVIGNAGITMPT